MPEQTEQHTVPADRPIIAFFDVDNTLLRGASIYRMGRGAWQRGYLRLRDILRFAWHQTRFVAVGENKKHMISFRQRALHLARGHSEAELTELAREVYQRDIEPHLWPETVELTQEHRSKGHQVWLVSATPVAMAEVIAGKLGLSGALGTVLESEGGRLTGEIVGELVHGERKAEVARDLAERLGAELADCWAYSDSSNDLPLLSLVGNRVVVNPDKALLRHAREHGWDVMRLDPASIRAARRRVRREARTAQRNAAR